MFAYLVGSKTRRELLIALWKDDERGTASSLARRTGVPFAACYDELKAMHRAGLARESLESGRLVYEAERRSLYAAAVKLLVTVPAGKSAKAATSKSKKRWDAVRTELALHGAPLRGHVIEGAVSSTPLEELLAQACELSHHDPSVAKVLPGLLIRKKSELDFAGLERALTDNKEKHTAGFLLAVAGALSGDQTLASRAEGLRDKRRAKVLDFFAASASSKQHELAERNTPQLARAWNFRLNMTLDDFRSVMQQFPLDAHGPEQTDLRFGELA